VAGTSEVAEHIASAQEYKTLVVEIGSSALAAGITEFDEHIAPVAALVEFAEDIAPAAELAEIVEHIEAAAELVESAEYIAPAADLVKFAEYIAPASEVAQRAYIEPGAERLEFGQVASVQAS